MKIASRNTKFIRRQTALRRQKIGRVRSGQPQPAQHGTEMDTIRRLLQRWGMSQTDLTTIFAAIHLQRTRSGDGQSDLLTSLINAVRNTALGPGSDFSNFVSMAARINGGQG